MPVSPLEAEFAKLFNNAFRYIQFAAANEFYLIAKSVFKASTTYVVHVAGTVGGTAFDVTFSFTTA